MRRIIANIAFLFLLTVCYKKVYAQATSAINRYRNVYKSYRKTEILAGVSWQGNLKDEVGTLPYIEIGLAKSLHVGSRHGPVSFGVYASEEMYFGTNTTVFGNKLGAYMHGMLADFGLAVIYYTDFKKGNLKVRPELGFGIGAMRIVAGFNIPTINNKAFELLRRNNGQISIQFLLPVKKKEVKRDKETIFKELFKKDQNGHSKNYLG
jgi:hypothetical protein